MMGFQAGVAALQVELMKKPLVGTWGRCCLCQAVPPCAWWVHSSRIGAWSAWICLWLWFPLLPRLGAVCRVEVLAGDGGSWWLHLLSLSAAFIWSGEVL